MSSSTLKIDVCTRWNSAYDMLARFLELQAAVVAVIRSKEFSGLKEKEISNLNDEEVVAAEELVVFLKLLKDITTYMCSEELPTSSIVMPLLEGLVVAMVTFAPKKEIPLQLKFVCWLVGCLTSQQQASVSQGRICSDNFTCCHTEIEVADQTFYLTQSQYTDTRPTSPSADPIMPGRVATGVPIFKSLV